VSAVARFADAFWRPAEVPFREILFDTPLQYRRLIRMIPFVYAWGAYTALIKIEQGRVLQAPLDGPLWPIFWMEWIPWQVGGGVVLSLVGLGGVAAVLRPRAQWGRVTAFLGIFLFLAMDYSHRGIEHRTYTTVLLCFFLALIPSLPRPQDASEDIRRRALLIAFGGVSFTLFTYTWAGAIKIWGVVDALIRTNDVVFDFSIVPLHLLNRAYAHEHPLPLSEFLIDHTALARTGFFAAYYMETVSLAAAYRVHLHRWWMAVLAGFHVLTELTMSVFFLPATGLLAILFFLTPFARDSFNWRAVVAELPWFGPLISALLFKLDGVAGRREKVTVFALDECRVAQSWLARAREANPRDDVCFESGSSSAFGILAKQHPGLRRSRSLVSISERDGKQTARFDAEAALFSSAGLRGIRGWAFALLLIPLPLSQLGYRALVRRSRGVSSRSQAPSDPA